METSIQDLRYLIDACMNSSSETTKRRGEELRRDYEEQLSTSNNALPLTMRWKDREEIPRLFEQLLPSRLSQRKINKMPPPPTAATRSLAKPTGTLSSRVKSGKPDPHDTTFARHPEDEPKQGKSFHKGLMQSIAVRPDLQGVSSRAVEWLFMTYRRTYESEQAAKDRIRRREAEDLLPPHKLMTADEESLVARYVAQTHHADKDSGQKLQALHHMDGSFDPVIMQNFLYRLAHEHEAILLPAKFTEALCDTGQGQRANLDTITGPYGITQATIKEHSKISLLVFYLDEHECAALLVELPNRTTTVFSSPYASSNGLKTLRDGLTRWLEGAGLTEDRVTMCDLPQAFPSDDPDSLFVSAWPDGSIFYGASLCLGITSWLKFGKGLRQDVQVDYGMSRAVCYWILLVLSKGRVGDLSERIRAYTRN